MISLLDNSLDEFTIQLKLSTTATLGQKKVAIVERFKQESTKGLSAKKAAVVERWPLVRSWTVPLLKHFPFLSLLRVVAILANKANSESQRVPPSFKFVILPQYKT